MAADRPTVLVVEDDPTLALGLEINLRAEGFRVLSARDGATALRVGLDLGAERALLLEAAAQEVADRERRQVLRRGADRHRHLLLAREVEPQHAELVVRLDHPPRAGFFAPHARQ